MKTDKIELEIETKGFEEATDKLQEMTDAMSNMPSQVVIRNCRDCVINVHPSQTIIGDRRPLLEILAMTRGEKKNDSDR